MTITAAATKYRYEGNGVTAAFSYPNRVYAQTDLKVDLLTRSTSALVETLTLTTDYTVTIAANGQATVTITNATKIPSITQDILVRLDLPLTQATELPTGTPFPAKSVEDAVDKLTSIAQSLAEVDTRTLKFSAQSPVTNAVIADPVADATLAFDGTGGAIKAGATLGDIANASANATAAAASASSAAASAATIGGFDLSGTPAADDAILWDTGAAKFVRKTIAQLRTALGISYTPPTTTVGASISLLEGTSNGTNTARLKSPDSLTSDVVATLPNASGTLARTDNETFNSPSINTQIIGTVSPKVCEGRLTLTSGTPVTTSDVTGATAIYFTPYNGVSVALFSGFSWVITTFSELTLNLGTVISGRPYDVFLDWNGGTPILVQTAWTNDTTRAVALTRLDGVLVKSSTTTQRYLGTFYTTSTTTTEDSDTKRYLWNYCNRVLRRLRKLETTPSWVYSTAAYRQTNGSAVNQVDFITGVQEDTVLITAQSYWSNNTATNRICYTGVGINSTTVNSADLVDPVSNYATSNNFSAMRATYNAVPPLGKNSAVWLEYGAGADTQTWRGANAPAQSGLTGTILC